MPHRQPRGCELAATHLLGLRHRRLAAIVGPNDASTARDRLAGFRAGLRARGVDLSAVAVPPGRFTREFGYAAMGQLLQAGDPPTTLRCGLGALVRAAIELLLDGADRGSSPPAAASCCLRS